MRKNPKLTPREIQLRQQAWYVKQYARDPQHRGKMKNFGKFHHMFRELICIKRNEVRPLIGCTLIELADHLESQFKPGMTWENYGKRKGQWTVDHIVNTRQFDLTSESSVRACWNYKNLRPMWQHENVRKGDKLLLVGT